MLLAVVSLCFSSCKKEDNSGKAEYVYGAYSVHLDNECFNAAGEIQEIYLAEFAKIGSVDKVQATLTVEGVYKDLDAKVLAACKAADAKCGSVHFSSDCYLGIRVKAYYYATTTAEEIFEKTYGNK